MTAPSADAVAPGNVQRATMYQPLLDYFESTVWSRSLREFLTTRPFTHLTFTFGVITVQVVNVVSNGQTAGRAALIYVSDTGSDADAIAFATELDTPVGLHLVEVRSGLKAEQSTAILEEQRFRRYAGLFEQLGTRWPRSQELLAQLAREQEPA